MMKNNKGITLTALVIMIIILFIIAGVTIGVSTNSDLLGIASKTANKQDEASIKQILDSIYLSERNKYNSGFISEEIMWSNIVNNIINYTTVEFEVPEADTAIANREIQVSINGEISYKITMEKGVEIIK